MAKVPSRRMPILTDCNEKLAGERQASPISPGGGRWRAAFMVYYETNHCLKIVIIALIFVIYPLLIEVVLHIEIITGLK